MQPTTFKQRFAAQESIGEAFLNRSKQLGALLGNRVSLADVKKKNIVKQGNSKLQAQQEALKLEQTRNQLSGLLKVRATKEDLAKRNILLEFDDDQGAHDQLKDAKKLLTNFLLARPAQAQLRSRRILRGQEEEGAHHAEAKNVLASFLLARPDPKVLADRKILAGSNGGGSTKTPDELLPRFVDFFNGKKVTAVSCGWGHTAAVTDNGEMYTFGTTSNGRLGLGEIKEAPSTPMLVESLKARGAVTSMCCGDNHTAAVVGGKLYTWGMGSWGRLGLGNQEDAWSPTWVEIPDDETSIQVACGAYHTLVITQEKNNIYGFGWNKNGRVGVGKEAGTTVTVPTRLAVISGDKRIVTSVSCGQGVSLAVTGAGLFVWGAGSDGATGLVQKADQWIPVQLEGLQGVLAASCGTNHCLAVTDKGECYSWGQNTYSQCGLPAEQKSVDTPTLVPGLEGVTLVAAGKAHSLASTATGAYSWGRGTNGMLGHGDDESQASAKQIEAIKGAATSLSGAWIHSAVVTGEGQLHTFGSSQNGKLGL